MTLIITFAQSHPSSAQYSSTKAYSPGGTGPPLGNESVRVSVSATFGNQEWKGRKPFTSLAISSSDPGASVCRLAAEVQENRAAVLRLAPAAPSGSPSAGSASALRCRDVRLQGTPAEVSGNEEGPGIAGSPAIGPDSTRSR